METFDVAVTAMRRLCDVKKFQHPKTLATIAIVDCRVDTQTSGMNYGTNYSCHRTFAAIGTPRVGTVDYKRQGMADPSTDGRGVSSPLPQLLKRLSSGHISDGTPELDRARGTWSSTTQLPEPTRSSGDRLVPEVSSRFESTST